MSEQATGSEPSVQRLRMLRTKLFIPRAHPDLVERAWLDERLNEGLRSKLLLVSAPAGFGKTTLLSNWIARTSRPVAWVSLDERDNDPARFWAYFIAALQTLQPGCGEASLAMLQALQHPPIEVILTDLINDLSSFTQEFILVLDDYHSITSPAVHQALSFLLDNLPPSMHLVIASRTDPPLPLPLLQGRRELAVLHPAELRFNPAEIAAFMNQVMRMGLSQADIAALDQLTEGWIAGLQLAAISMQGLEDIPGFIRSFSGSHRFVFDYLAQEVLDRQSESTRLFLLQTAVLDRLSGPLCDAVTGRPGSQTVFEQLERANLFIVSLDQQRQWYRYHHLFLDFLRARLEQEFERPAIRELHLRASQWHQKHESPAEAISHALLAEDFDQAADLIGKWAVEMFARSELVTVIQWMKSMPEAYVHQNSRLSMIYAWALLATGQSDAVEPHLLAIEHILGTVADGSPASLALPPETRGILGEVSNMRASLAFNRMAISDVIRLSHQAQAYLGHDVETCLFNSPISLRAVSSFNLAVAYEFSGEVLAASQAYTEMLAYCQQEPNPHLEPMAASHLAGLQILLGHLREAKRIYQRALKEVERGGQFSPMYGMLYTGLGNLLYEWNELASAQSHFSRGIDLGRQWNQWEILLSGYFGLARVKAAQDDFESALVSMQELVEMAQRLQVLWALPAVEAQRAALWLRAGDLESAARWAQSLDIIPNSDIPYPREAEAVIQARILIALASSQKSGQEHLLEQAAHLVDRLAIAADSSQRCGRLIEILTLQAILYDAQGDSQRAIPAFQRALSLAEPEGYLRIFLDEGEPVARLLAAIIHQREAGGTEAYAQELLASFRGQAPDRLPNRPTRSPSAAVQNLVEPMSARELEVLQLIAAGLSNQEIAETLILSINTVKTHVKNIFGRLEAHNRAQAIARARELGLV